MPDISLDDFQAVVESAAKFNNQLTKIERAANAMDSDNWGAGKIFDPAKLTTDGTSENDALVHNGSAWSAQALASVVSPSWTSYTPVLTASSSNPNLGSGATQQGAYVQMGKLVIGYAHIVFGSSPTGGSGTWAVSLPVTASNSSSGLLGVGLLDFGNIRELYAFDDGSHNRISFFFDAGVSGVGGFVAAGNPISSVLSGDSLFALFAYEAA